MAFLCLPMAMASEHPLKEYLLLLRMAFGFSAMVVTITAKLHEALAAGSKRLLLSGFGVGLSWGTLILQTDAPVLPPMVES